MKLEAKARLIVAAEAVEWFKSMSKEQQQQYLKLHPGSKLAQGVDEDSGSKEPPLKNADTTTSAQRKKINDEFESDRAARSGLWDPETAEEALNRPTTNVEHLVQVLNVKNPATKKIGEAFKQQLKTKNPKVFKAVEDGERIGKELAEAQKEYESNIETRNPRDWQKFWKTHKMKEPTEQQRERFAKAQKEYESYKNKLGKMKLN